MMRGRMSLMVAATMAGMGALAAGSSAAPVGIVPNKARRAIALDPLMQYGTGRAGKRTTAQDKRRAVKVRNRKRSKR